MPAAGTLPQEVNGYNYNSCKYKYNNCNYYYNNNKRDFKLSEKAADHKHIV